MSIENPAKQVEDNFGAALGLPPMETKDLPSLITIEKTDEAEVERRAAELTAVEDVVNKRLKKIVVRTEDDLQQGRDLTDELLRITTSSIQRLASMAENSDSARAYEVLFNATNTAMALAEAKTKQAEASIKLLERMRKMDIPLRKKSEDDDPSKITLSTFQLQEMLRMAAEKKGSGAKRVEPVQ